MNDQEQTIVVQPTEVQQAYMDSLAAKRAAVHALRQQAGAPWHAVYATSVAAWIDGDTFYAVDHLGDDPEHPDQRGQYMVFRSRGDQTVELAEVVTDAAFKNPEAWDQYPLPDTEELIELAQRAVREQEDD